MPRHVRIEFPGAIHHVSIRGNGREDIFVDDRDRERFLSRLAESVETYGIRLYLYCLMTNHVHLLLETTTANLSRFMQSLETGYTVYYNLKHGRSGHLFQGRYKTKLVEGDEYLLKLGRYIHLNPVCIRRLKNLPVKERIRHLREYPWSSYRSYTGAARELEYVTYGPVLAEFTGKRGRQRRDYRRYVEEGLAQEDEELLQVMKASPAAIGGEEFRSWVWEKCVEKGEDAARSEDVSFRREIPLLDKEMVLEVTCRHLGVRPSDLREKKRKSILRAVASRMLIKYAGLTHRQVAEALGMKSGTAASLQARKANELKDGNRAAARVIGVVEAELDNANQGDDQQ
jgi:REP element-mobilizing transposase RayT